MILWTLHGMMLCAVTADTFVGCRALTDSMSRLCTVGTPDGGAITMLTFGTCVSLGEALGAYLYDGWFEFEPLHRQELTW
jgi:hypothetical protein